MTHAETIAAELKLAKKYALDNDAESARKALLYMLESLKTVYSATADPAARTRLGKEITLWLKVCETLRESGITVGVKKTLDIMPEEVPASEQGHVAEAFEKAKDAVVKISVSSGCYCASGTGFIVSKKGYLLTNRHVVFCEETDEYYEKIKMSYWGEKKEYSLRVVNADKKRDVAVCKFDPETVPVKGTIKLYDNYDEIKQGAEIVIVGNCFDMGLAPNTGIIRYTRGPSKDLVCTALTNPGDSGGPVLANNGECIGINKSRTVSSGGAPAYGLANATPVDEIKGFLSKWNIVL